MAKNKIKKSAGNDGIERLNYLYQAATLLTTSNHPHLARYYSLQLKLSSHKLVQRLDKSIKRNICKGCQSILVPGLNCDVEEDGSLVRWQCRYCTRAKNFQKPKGFIL
jgi:ribonuclease P protein subunit RPR2